MKINYFYPEYEVVRQDSRCTRCRICEKQCANGVHFYDETHQVMLSEDARCVNCHPCHQDRQERLRLEGECQLEQQRDEGDL